MRTSKGHVFIEMIAMIPVFVVVTYLSLDCFMVLAGAWFNDLLCRDAARAAAQETTGDDALRVAQALVRTRVQEVPTFIQPPQVLSGPGQFQYNDFRDAKGLPDTDKGPFVKVTTGTTIRMPFPIFWNGNALNDTITMRQSYTFPIVTLSLPDTED